MLSGSGLSLDDNLQRFHIEHCFGQQFLQSGILHLEALEPAGFRNLLSGSGLSLDDNLQRFHIEHCFGQQFLQSGILHLEALEPAGFRDLRQSGKAAKRQSGKAAKRQSGKAAKRQSGKAAKRQSGKAAKRQSGSLGSPPAQGPRGGECPTEETADRSNARYGSVEGCRQGKALSPQAWPKQCSIWKR